MLIGNVPPHSQQARRTCNSPPARGRLFSFYSVNQLYHLLHCCLIQACIFNQPPLPKHPALHKYLSNPSPRLAACLMALLLGFAATPAKAQPANASDHDRARAAARAGKILPLPKVLAGIRPNYPGEVLDIDLEQSGERWFYEIKLLQEGGQLRKLIVDASTGTVLLDRVPLGRRWRRHMLANESASAPAGHGQYRRNGCGPLGCPTAPAPATLTTPPPHQTPKP